MKRRKKRSLYSNTEMVADTVEIVISKPKNMLIKYEDVIKYLNSELMFRYTSEMPINVVQFRKVREEIVRDEELPF